MPGALALLPKFAGHLGSIEDSTSECCRHASARFYLPKNSWSEFNGVRESRVPSKLARRRGIRIPISP